MKNTMTAPSNIQAVSTATATSFTDAVSLSQSNTHAQIVYR